MIDEGIWLEAESRVRERVAKYVRKSCSLKKSNRRHLLKRCLDTRDGSALSHAIQDQISNT